MLSLTTVSNDGHLNNPEKLKNDLRILKSRNTTGIMADFWWGIIERNEKQYDWRGYLQLAEICKELGLKLAIVLSFHRCGGNVGDTCNIPIPSWVRRIGETNPNIYYTDRNGYRLTEYLSSGVDHEKLFNGRTGIDLYNDFMKSFKSKFAIILKIQLQH